MCGLKIYSHDFVFQIERVVFRPVVMGIQRSFWHAIILLRASFNVWRKDLGRRSLAAGRAVVSFVGCCGSVLFAGQPVVGTLDFASGGSVCRAAGWAKDLNSTVPIQVDFYMNAPFGQGGKPIGSVIAKLSRTDLSYGDKIHGFDYSFPLSEMLYDGREHRIYAYGVAVKPNSSNVLLAVSSKTVRCTTLNVKRFGAKGDGTTDDAPAIQSAINATREGDSVFIPSGTYMLGTSHRDKDVGSYPSGKSIESALMIKRKGLIVFGVKTNNQNTSVLKLMGKMKMRAISITKEGSNVSLKNIMIDGNKSQRGADTVVEWPNGYVVDGLVMGWLTSDLAAEGIEVTNGMEDGIGCWLCRGFTVKNSNNHDNGTPYAGATGISCSATIGGTFTGNTLMNNSSMGIWMAFGTQSILVARNTIVNNCDGGLAMGGKAVGTNMKVGDANFTIKENDIKGNGSGRSKDGTKKYPQITIDSARHGTIVSNSLGGEDPWISVGYRDSPNSELKRKDPELLNWEIRGNRTGSSEISCTHVQRN